MDNNSAAEELWKDDLLGRRQDADFLQYFLVGVVQDRKSRGLQGSYVINIDGHWGAGKTFLVNRLSKQLKLAGYIVAEINAWRDDHSDDPFVAVLAAVDAAIEQALPKEASERRLWEQVKMGAAPIVGRVGAGVVKTLVKKYVGENLHDLISNIPGDGSALEKALDEASGRVVVEVERVVDQASEKLIEQYARKSAAIEGFRGRLSKAAGALLEKTKGPLFVVVNELDRCRPSYAVALLERVKHLFEVEDVVFVFATNTQQMQYSVVGAYGPGFNGYKYLKRFFERTYLLEEPKPLEFLKQRLEVLNVKKVRAPKDDPFGFLAMMVEAYRLDLREIDQLVDLMTTTVAVWHHDSPIDLVLLVPLAIVFVRDGTVEWDAARRSIPKGLNIFIRHRQSRDGSYTAIELDVGQALRKSAPGHNRFAGHN